MPVEALLFTVQSMYCTKKRVDSDCRVLFCGKQLNPIVECDEKKETGPMKSL